MAPPAGPRGTPIHRTVVDNLYRWWTVNLKGRWQERAECRPGPDGPRDPDPWFPDKGESPLAGQRKCNRCPVKVECLASAVPDRNTSGIWGGAGERPRRLLRWKLAESSHPDQAIPPGTCDLTECEYCFYVDDHFRRLTVIALTGRGPSPAWNTNGPRARCGTKASAKRGCQCFACAAALSQPHEVA